MPSSQPERIAVSSLFVQLTSSQRTRAAAEMLLRALSAVTWPAIGDNGCGVHNAVKEEAEETEEGAGEKEEAEERKASNSPYEGSGRRGMCALDAAESSPREQQCWNTQSMVRPSCSHIAHTMLKATASTP